MKTAFRKVVFRKLEGADTRDRIGCTGESHHRLARHLSGLCTGGPSPGGPSESSNCPKSRHFGKLIPSALGLGTFPDPVLVSGSARNHSGVTAITTTKIATTAKRHGTTIHQRLPLRDAIKPRVAAQTPTIHPRGKRPIAKGSTANAHSKRRLASPS